MAILQNTDLRILVVDDQDSVRSHLSQELLRMGVKQVLEAASAEEALAVFEQHQPDLVLLDILMPGKNGYWIAERIRDLDDGRWTPIIFLTGMGRDEDLWEGIRAGGDDYLVKPVRATVLAAKIRAMQQCRSVKSERHFFDGILGLGHTNLTRIPPVGSARRQHEAADVLSHGRKLGRDGPRGV